MKIPVFMQCKDFNPCELTDDDEHQIHLPQRVQESNPALISIRIKCFDKEQNGCNTQDQFLVGHMRSTARTHLTEPSTSVHLCPRLHGKQFPSISNGLQQPTRVIYLQSEPRDLFDCSLKDTTAIQKPAETFNPGLPGLTSLGCLVLSRF